MKISNLLLVFLLASITIQAQTEKLSLNLMHWLHNEEHAPARNRTAIAFKTNNIDYLNAFIKVGRDVKEDDFSRLGILIGTKAGNIWTVRIPKENVPAFTKLGGIDYIELDRPVRKQMDSVRYYTHVDSIAVGSGLPLPYAGKGVVVGILDDGFDYTHPAFFDTSYLHSRIKRIWNQSLSGTPPAGYSYGAELSDTASILNRKYDYMNYGSHGNMVANIAAGTGYGSKNNRLYRGVAYESDLVMITCPTSYLDWREMNMTTLIDGFNYTFKYAQSVGKPAVVNASLGSNVGPHDGTSLFSQACDNLVGPGKILVFAAMNLRGTKTHLGKTFSGSDTVLKTLIPNLKVDNGLYRNYIELWGDSLKTFCLQFGLYKNGTAGNTSAVYCMDNSVKDFFLIGSDNDTCFVTLGTKQQELNKKPHATIELFTKTKDTLLLSAYANAGSVHMWQEYFDSSWNAYYGEFVGKDSSFQAGDDAYTIGEMGCARSVVTVAATVSKQYWRTVSNAVLYNPAYTGPGTIAPYSSRGPDIHGRMKPDIAAPGGMIASAVSSYDSEYSPGGGYYPNLVISKYVSPRNNRTYSYGIGQGTSFASPVVTGVTALLLQVNPALSPERIKDILYRTAIKDSLTTANPDPGTWGAGKVNAYAAIKEAIKTAGVIPIPKDEKDISVYPNPASDKFSVHYDSDKAGNFLVELTSMSGQIIQTKFWQISAGSNLLPLQMDSNLKGVYLLSITGNGGTVTKRIVLQ